MVRTELKIEYLKKTDLKPYAKNAKLHPPEQIAQIKKSIEKNGFNDPIGIWGDNEIVEGHGRLLAAMEIPEIETVPVIRLDHMTEKQRRAYILIHNKLTMNSGFDLDILKLELDDIGTAFDMSDFGFDLDFSLDEEKGKEVVEDDYSEDAEPVCKPGDLWILGKHRLLCGDSTDVEAIEKLMGVGTC